MRRVTAKALQVQIGVAALVHHRGVHRVFFSHGFARGLDVRGRFEHRRRRGHIVSHTDFHAGAGLRTNGLHGHAMREHHVVRQLRQTLRSNLQAGRMEAVAVSELDERTHLVHRHKMLDLV